MNRKTLIATAVTAALAVPAYTQANDLNFDFYGSARIAVENVRPDNQDENDGGLDSYSGFRDAYSRIGFNADYQLAPGLTLIGQLELPLDLANKKVQDPWDQDDGTRGGQSRDIRVAMIGVQGDIGTLQYGQMWMPYYNAIAFPVDMFSSYYSGFATQTVFRRSDTVAYYSPDMNGLSFAFAWSEDNGNDGDDRIQLTGSYNFGDTTVALGMDDLRGDDNDRSIGASVAHAMGDLYLGAKYERYSTDTPDEEAFFKDGDTAMNVYAGYTLGQNTFKIMVAEVKSFGETVVHLGYDYQFNSDLKFFAEYYREQETAAITEKRGGLRETAWTAGGGQVFTAGMRYDF
ncbi:porin [Ectothiorhodospira variabilis]|uniref:porin n=1 Tax=Ectothiorhodospira variabilis TaxID=505694 RepID=UPI001EFAFAC1|nr:porin [Ectothiorhodospira variabilis]MCG5494709.1 porin [Ectothiorhodospira variabilis]MCG5503527.1 porin [Ectothiorhodospira variabilis]MCG5506758.1 porin [Ectothiorhodospira variabilis]